MTHHDSSLQDLGVVSPTGLTPLNQLDESIVSKEPSQSTCTQTVIWPARQPTTRSTDRLMDRRAGGRKEECADGRKSVGNTSAVNYEMSRSRGNVRRRRELEGSANETQNYLWNIDVNDVEAESVRRHMCQKRSTNQTTVNNHWNRCLAVLDTGSAELCSVDHLAVYNSTLAFLRTTKWIKGD